MSTRHAKASSQTLRDPATGSEVATRHEVSVHQGPLPHPEVLEGYNRASPGAADRIITMAEAHAAHQRQLEAEAVRAHLRQSLIGLILGSLIALGGLTAATIMVLGNHDWAGGIIGGTTLAGIVGTFVYGSQGRGSSDADTNQRS